MLKMLAPHLLWIAEMPVQRMGFEFGARMTAVRLPSGGLWVHSPIALTPALREDLEAVGPVRYLVAPSRMHYEHLAEFSRAFPRARVFAAASLQGVREMRDVRLDGLLGETPPAEWEGAFEQSPFRGSALYDEVDFFHPASRTLILTDLCFNIPAERSWTTRLFAGMLGILGRFSVSRSLRLTLRDRAAARASVERLLAWDFDRVLIAHGDYLETGGQEALRRAFEWLLR